MWDLNYESPKEIEDILNQNGLYMNRNFGQNFLISKSMREAIASYLGLDESKSAYEIGPGLGSITALALKTGARVKVFEIDRGFCNILKEKAFKDEPGFSLVMGDATETIFRQRERADVIYGNLPYNVGSKMIVKLIEKNFLSERMVFMLQKEVAERMVIAPEESEFPHFSVLTQLDYSNEIVLKIKNSSFFPEPKVESALVVMKRKKAVFSDRRRELFIRLVSDLYKQRRKTVKNNLKSGFLGNFGGDGIVSALLEDLGYQGNERSENFRFDDLFKLTLKAEELLLESKQ